MEKIYIDIRKTPLYKFLLKKVAEKGKVEGLKEAILFGVQIKFGKDKLGLVRKKIEDIDSIEKLRVIKAEVLKANSWWDFLRSIEKLILNSNSKSIKKNSKRQNKKERRK